MSVSIHTNPNGILFVCNGLVVEVIQGTEALQSDVLITVREVCKDVLSVYWSMKLYEEDV